MLVVALGADLHPDATPGLVEHGHEFYTVDGAFALRDVLADFPGGDVVVAVTSTPFKCPPAPSETALLVHDLLRRRGLLASSSVSLVMPLGVPIPPSPAASQALLGEFAERGISWHPGTLVRSLEPGRAILGDGSSLPFDLFLGVPVHRAPAVVVEAGLAEDGWIPVDPLTLRTRFEDVYAVGDVTSVGTPKAGVFAEGQAAVVAAQLVARARGAATDASYDGRGICYLEFGDDQVAKVDVTFLSGQAPAGDLVGPSRELWPLTRPTSAPHASTGGSAGTGPHRSRADPSLSRRFRGVSLQDRRLEPPASMAAVAGRAAECAVLPGRPRRSARRCRRSARPCGCCRASRP